MHSAKTLCLTASSPPLLKVVVGIEVDAVATGLASIRPLQRTMKIEVLQSHIVAGVRNPLDGDISLDAMKPWV